MAKYFRFEFNAGYVGTDCSQVFKFNDDVTEKEVNNIYEEWYADQRSDYGDCIEIEVDEDDNDEDIEDYTK